jgi:predicted esterase
MLTRFPQGATAGIVLLHGRGGSARDILSLLDHAGLPQIAAAVPEAQGNSWWPTSFLAPSAQMEPYVVAGLDAVAEAVDVLRASGLGRHQIWLCGFSQGACLALEAFARNGEGLAGVFALSGGLVGVADLEGPSSSPMGYLDKQLTYSGPRTGTAYLSVHERDPHIPLSRVQSSAAALRALGAEVAVQIFKGAGHGVMPEDIAALRQHLNG